MHWLMIMPVNTFSAANKVVVPWRLESWVIVSPRPLTIGGDACVRSSACTEDFSSAHNTIAFSGGFKYSPTTSTSFSSNFGSLDSLNVSTRCGLRPRADHTCCTVDFDTPVAAAMVRQLQWVSPCGR